jgi:hypothetical protein
MLSCWECLADLEHCKLVRFFEKDSVCLRDAESGSGNAAAVFRLRTAPNSFDSLFGHSSFVGGIERLFGTVPLPKLPLRLCVCGTMLDELLLLLAPRTFGLGQEKPRCSSGVCVLPHGA